LTSTPPSTTPDPYVSQFFKTYVPYQQGNFWIHKGYYSVMTERAEFCSACHDVTNPLTIKNQLGKWVGGFPIEPILLANPYDKSLLYQLEVLNECG